MTPASGEASSVRPGDPLCPPPDPNPRPASFKLPQNACDCHAHTIGPARLYPFVPERSYTPPDALMADYLKMIETLGVRRAVLVQPSMHGVDNTPMLEAIESVAPDRVAFRAVAVVPENASDQEYLDLHRRGVRGLRLNLVYHGGNSALDQAEFFAGRIRDLGWHLEILCDVSASKDLIGKLDRLHVPIVFDHFGHLGTEKGIADPGFRTMLEMVRNGNTWVKISGAYRITRQMFPYDDVRPFADALLEAAPDRLLWGSDWPHTVCKVPMPNDGDLIDLLASWVEDSQTLKTILVDNPERFYQFPRAETPEVLA